MAFSKKKGLIEDQGQPEVTPDHITYLRENVMKTPVLPRITAPFGQPNIDDWLHWFYDGESQTATVRFRGTYYEIATSLWEAGGFGVQAVKLDKKKVVRLTPTTYEALPEFVRDAFPQWRKALTRAMAGVSESTVQFSGNLRL